MVMRAPRSLVGLDLGSHRLKAVEVVKSNGGWKVARIGVVETPPGAVTKGVAANPEALFPAIRNLFESAGIQSKRVASALGGQAVTIRELTVPEMSEAELQQVMRFEAERYLPPDAGEATSDYRIQGRIPEERKLNILLVAAGRHLVEKQLAPLTMAGLATRVLEAIPLSMVRAVASSNGASEKAAMFVDIGAESSDILIVERARLRLARNVPIGGNALTRAIAAALQIDAAAAQSLKEGKAAIELDGETPPDATLGSANRAILPVVGRLATELRRSLDFYLAGLKGRAISKVVLVGGTAKLKNLARFLGEEIGVPVEIGNPFAGCGTDAGLAPTYLASVAPIMAAAVGLALRGVQA